MRLRRSATHAFLAHDMGWIPDSRMTHGLRESRARYWPPSTDDDLYLCTGDDANVFLLTLNPESS